MSFLSHLRTLLRPVSGTGPAEEADERLTIAVLLTVVAHADGRMVAAEEEALQELLRERFRLTGEQAERLVAEASGLEGLIDPATTLVDRILHDVGPEERPNLLALAWRMAASDGAVHAFEDDLVWRTGRLLGFSDAALSALKDDALGAGTAGRSHA